jgi:uncharacterized membrane protein YbhN (UPF0104 family)
VTPLRRVLAAVTSPVGRVVGTAVLLGVVAASIDWGLIGDRLGAGRWEWFALAVAAVAVALVVGAVRWHRLLLAAGVPVTLRQSARAYAIGVFSNNFLPTAFGGDAARAWLVARSGRPLMRAATSVLFDRVSALACFVALGWLLLAADPDPVPRSLVLALAAVTAAGCAGVAGLLAGARVGALRRLSARLLRSAGAEAADVGRAYAADRRLMAEAALLGIAYQALVVVSVWFLARAIGVPLALSVLAVALPVVLVATLIPISIAGFGLREGAFVVLLARAGVASTDAALLSVLTVAALALASLPGGIALLVHGGPRFADGEAAPPEP